jgi:hypothetical protein
MSTATNPKAFPLADANLTNQILDLVQQVECAFSLEIFSTEAAH